MLSITGWVFTTLDIIRQTKNSERSNNVAVIKKIQPQTYRPPTGFFIRLSTRSDRRAAIALGYQIQRYGTEPKRKRGKPYRIVKTFRDLKTAEAVLRRIQKHNQTRSG